MQSACYLGRSIIDPHSHIIPLKQIPDELINVPCILGIDEAGRGPVLGPLVYSLFITPLDKHQSLKQDLRVAGCQSNKFNVLSMIDSKEMTPENRLIFASSMLSTLFKSIRMVALHYGT